MEKKIILLTVLLTAAMIFGLNGAVHALPCTYGYVNGGGSDYLCQDGVLGESNDSAESINAEGFFELSDWVELERKNTPGDTEIEDFNVGLAVDPDTGAVSGTWSFTNTPWNDYGQIMIVLKDGRLTVPGGNTWYSAYLVSYGDTSGSWSTGGPELSHMTIYGSSTPVPEPATMILLGGGIFGVGLFRKKLKA